MSHVFRLRLLNQIKGTVVCHIIQCIYIYILSNDLYTDSGFRVFALLLSFCLWMTVCRLPFAIRTFVIHHA